MQGITQICVSFQSSTVPSRLGNYMVKYNVQSFIADKVYATALTTANSGNSNHLQSCPLSYLSSDFIVLGIIIFTYLHKSACQEVFHRMKCQ
jgi:hypothetical protein